MSRVVTFRPKGDHIHLNYDVELSYDDYGSGEPVLLVHGHPFDRSMWQPQIGELVESGRRIVVPDLRGYGQTEVRPGVTTLSDFADDIISLLGFLGIDRTAMVGLSMGGQIVMDLAARFAERITMVVLVSTSPDAESSHGRRVRMETADHLVREGMTSYTETNISRMVCPATTAQRPDIVDHVRKMMLEAPPSGAAAALRGRALRREYVSTLEALEIPALIVVGRDDEFTPVANAQRMHRSVADSELVVIDDAGHLPNLERPDIFNSALMTFLDGRA
ncbi:MAG: alpha/beta hydrolase [Thermoanaerobaculia bacterium]|nr:alpha/beta hydrolase [Thermoanaerobaculia bacterium]